MFAAAVADGEDGSAASSEAEAQASMEQAIDSGMATFSAGFATGLGVFSEVRSQTQTAAPSPGKIVG